MGLRVRNLVKTFGGHAALKGVSIKARTGEFMALLGPSGSGKTTLLRCLAGLEVPDAGTIAFDGEDVAGTRPSERNVGFVFQHYALFRHMTVFENVAFGLRVRPRASRPREDEIKARVMRLLRLVQLEIFAQRYPSQLSGGQRQRVALARALAIEPKMLLLDEPFGALDAKVRKELRRWLRTLHDDMGLTSVFVTHDQEEALELADQVVVMRDGQVEQRGTPIEVYGQPRTPFVADFIGGSNQFEGRVENGRVMLMGLDLGPAPADAPAGPTAVHVRRHDFDILETGAPGGLGVTARSVFAAGPVVAIDFQLDGESGAERIVDVVVPHSAVPGAATQIGRRYVLRPRRFALFRPDDPAIRAP